MTLRSLALRLSLLVGRRRLYRLSRFLSMGARGDVPNDPATNGEQMIQRLGMDLASSPAVVFDVGSNLGDWTASLLRQASGKRVMVHAFEPCGRTYERLAHRIRENGWTNVFPIQRGCSRAPGTAAMNVYGSGAGTNTLAAVLDPSPDIGIEVVDLTSIDEYCLTNEIARIDLLKIDAEGCDYDVMIGAREMLQRGSVRLLQFEYNQRWIGSRQYLRDVFVLLVPMGYQIGKIVGKSVEFYPRWQWELETYREGNYIACSQQVAKMLPQTKPDWLF